VERNQRGECHNYGSHDDVVCTNVTASPFVGVLVEKGTGSVWRGWSVAKHSRLRIVWGRYSGTLANDSDGWISFERARERSQARLGMSMSEVMKVSCLEMRQSHKLINHSATVFKIRYPFNSIPAKVDAIGRLMGGLGLCSPICILIADIPVRHLPRPSYPN
jgi:hypothetical protein